MTISLDTASDLVLKATNAGLSNNGGIEFVLRLVLMGVLVIQASISETVDSVVRLGVCLSDP